MEVGDIWEDNKGVPCYEVVSVSEGGLKGLIRSLTKGILVGRYEEGYLIRAGFRLIDTGYEDAEI